MSTNGLDLTVWRGLQGVGAALITPASLALLTPDPPPHLGWNWLFAINAPLGVFSLLVMVAAIPRAAEPDGAVPWQQPHSTLPLRTAMPACLFFGGFAYCLIEGPRYGFTAVRIVVPGLMSLICVIAVVITASPTRSTPLADLLGRRAFAGGIVTQLLWGLGVTGVFFFTPQFPQNVLSCSAASGTLASRASRTCRVRAWTAWEPGCSKTVGSSVATQGWADQEVASVGQSFTRSSMSDASSVTPDP
jgi:hypothetical protein